MAAPNIVNVTSIFGKTTYDTNVSTSTIQPPTANSGKVFKVNTIIAANIDGTNTADITVVVPIRLVQLYSI